MGLESGGRPYRAVTKVLFRKRGKHWQVFPSEAVNISTLYGSGWELGTQCSHSSQAYWQIAPCASNRNINIMTDEDVSE